MTVTKETMPDELFVSKGDDGTLYAYPHGRENKYIRGDLAIGKHGDDLHIAYMKGVSDGKALICRPVDTGALKLELYKYRETAPTGRSWFSPEIDDRMLISGIVDYLSAKGMLKGGA